MSPTANKKQSKSSAETKKPAKSPAATKKQSKSPAAAKKSEKSPKVEESKVKDEVAERSPENKPANGQAKKDETGSKDDGKTLKVQSAGAGQAGSDYNPSKKNYHPINDAFWKHGEK